KGEVELGEGISGEAEVEGGAILSNVLRRAGFRDGDHAVLPERPGERDLRRRGAVAIGDRLQRPAPEQPALLDWRIGHDWNPPRPAPRKQVELDPATAQVVEDLVGGDG